MQLSASLRLRRKVRARASYVGVTCSAVTEVMKMSEITGEREREKKTKTKKMHAHREWRTVEANTWKGLQGKVNKMVEVVAAIQSEFK